MTDSDAAASADASIDLTGASGSSADLTAQKVIDRTMTSGIFLRKRSFFFLSLARKSASSNDNEEYDLDNLVSRD